MVFCPALTSAPGPSLDLATAETGIGPEFGLRGEDVGMDISQNTFFSGPSGAGGDMASAMMQGEAAGGLFSQLGPGSGPFLQ